MINRVPTRIELKLEDDIYEYEEMMNSKSNNMFSPLQCEIEINLSNNEAQKEYKFLTNNNTRMFTHETDMKTPNTAVNKYENVYNQNHN